MESRTLRPYRHFWGLLAAVFPSTRIGVVSDLFVQAQPKLRAIFFLALANQPDYHPLLPDYFNCYLTTSWRDPAVTMLISTYDTSKERSESPWATGFRSCASILASEGISNLLHGEREASPSKIVFFILRGNNKLRAAARWDNAAVCSLLKISTPDDEDNTNLGRYLASRVLLRISHMVDRQQWSEESIVNLLKRTDSPHLGIQYATYVALYCQHRLTSGSLQQIMGPLPVTVAWNETAIDRVLSEITIKTGEAWHYTNPYRRACNLLRLIVYLRAHPNPEIITAISTARLRIRNIVRSFWRQESLQPPSGRVRSLSLGYLIYDWIERLERYLQTATW